jgi:hypothetical protein
VAVLVLDGAAVVEQKSSGLADGRHRPVVVEVAEPQRAARLLAEEADVLLFALLLLACACRFKRLELVDGAGVLGALEEVEVGAVVVEPGDALPLVVERDAGCEDDVVDAREQLSSRSVDEGAACAGAAVCQRRLVLAAEARRAVREPVGGRSGEPSTAWRRRARRSARCGAQRSLREAGGTPS